MSQKPESIPKAEAARSRSCSNVSGMRKNVNFDSTGEKKSDFLPCENKVMEKPLASGPAELFTRIDDYSVANAAAALSEGIVMTSLDRAGRWVPNSGWHS